MNILKFVFVSTSLIFLFGCDVEIEKINIADGENTSSTSESTKELINTNQQIESVTNNENIISTKESTSDIINTISTSQDIDHSDSYNQKDIVESENITYTSEGVVDDEWLQLPRKLENPLIVSNYDMYDSYGTGTGTYRYVDGGGGDVLLLAHSPNGVKQVLKNVGVIVENFRRLHIKGLDIEVDDSLFDLSRVLLIRTTPKESSYAMGEDVFIEGLRIEANFIAPNTDGISVYKLGVEDKPLKRFVIQNSRITGIGTISSTADNSGVHPDALHFQAMIDIDSVYIERNTITTMYQGVFAAWNQYAKSVSRQSNWNFREVSIESKDSSANRLITLQDDGYLNSQHPLTSYEDVYLMHTKAHQYIIGPSEIHENPASFKGTFDFESDLNGIISGIPVSGIPPAEFSPRSDVGIYYNSSHDFDLASK